MKRSNQSQNYNNNYIGTAVQRRTPTTEVLTGSFQNVLLIKNFDLVKKYLQGRVKSFQGETLKFHLKQWEELTSNREVLTTVSGVDIEITDNLPAMKLYQYSVIVETKHEPRQFNSLIFVRENFDLVFVLF